jgi:hypothetical protein
MRNIVKIIYVITLVAQEGEERIVLGRLASRK